MLRSTAGASKPGITTCVAPMLNVVRATTPAAWVSGAEVRHTGWSVPSGAQKRAPISVIVPHERNPTCTALAAPVVPPVGKSPTSQSGLP